MKMALESRDLFQKEMANRGIDNQITTEITLIKNYYLAETYHQQYLDKNPFGYCGLKGSGVACPLVLKKKNKDWVKLIKLNSIESYLNTCDKLYLDFLICSNKL